MRLMPVVSMLERTAPGGMAGQAEGGGVFGDLFALDQGHLPAGRLAGVAAQSAEIARLA